MHPVNGSTVRRADSTAFLIDDDRSHSTDSPVKNGASTSGSRQAGRKLFDLAGGRRAMLDPSVYPVNSAKYEQATFFNRVVKEARTKQGTNKANNLPEKSAKAMERYAIVQQEIMRAIESGDTVFSDYFEQINALREASREYEQLFERNLAYYRTSPTKHLWNMFAGAMAFTMCFGPGTLTSNALSSPLFALMISPIVWSLTERFVPMLRATSWANKAADVEFPLILQMQRRKWRDIARGWGGLPSKKYMFDEKEMTASEIRDRLSWKKTWRGKVVSDDMTYLCYTLSYTVRGSLLMALASTAFLNTDVGKAVSIVSLFVAGCAAGASTSVAFQIARRNAFKAKNPDNWQRGETLVKSREIWHAEATLIEAKIALVRKHRETSDGTEITELDLVIQYMQADLRKARLKSHFFGSIGYELSCLFQAKRSLGDGNTGEVAGKFLEFVSGFLGKSLCLLPSIVFNLVVAMAFTKESYPALVRHCTMFALNLILILGFAGRNDIQQVIRSMIGVLLGLCDILTGDGKFGSALFFFKGLWPADANQEHEQDADATSGSTRATPASDDLDDRTGPKVVHIDGEPDSASSDDEDEDQPVRTALADRKNDTAQSDRTSSDSA